MIEIVQLKEATRVGFEDIKKLLLQLHGDRASTYREPYFAQMEELVSDKKTLSIVAKDGERVIGMAVLFILARVGEVSGIIEDVVVDDKYRGQGIATKIMERLISIAREKSLRQLDLTSRASREAANHLYQKMGFEKRDTNVYRLRL